jgi:hypothetical protein
MTNNTNLKIAVSLLKEGKWDEAHQVVQDDESSEAAWLHGYLHKVEGDVGNAKYWYRVAGKKWREGVSLEGELVEIMESFKIFY